MSVDPNPIASGFLPSEEVKLLAQPILNVNISTSTMESAVDVSKFLLSYLPTPNIVLSSTPPPTIKTTNKLPCMSDVFDSLNTFVIEGNPSNKEKDEAFGAAPPVKPSRAQKLASIALRVSTKTHKIACVLAKWTVEVYTPGLDVAPLVFVILLFLTLSHPLILGIQLPKSFMVNLPILFAND